MTSDEVYKIVKTEKPRLIYISGKTSTGKSTFTKRLIQDFGYQVVELDQIVMKAVILPLKLDEGLAFREIYRKRDHKDWISVFVKAARDLIQKHIQINEFLVIEGAVANPDTLKELLDGFPKLTFIYFHPKNLDNYVNNLSSRFMTSDENNLAGLPLAFWTFIDPNEFSQFCESRVITEKLEEGIKRYASLSQNESKKRLSEFEKYFKDIYILEI